MKEVFWNNLADKNFDTYNEVKEWLRNNSYKWARFEDDERFREKLMSYIVNLPTNEFLEMVEVHDPAAYNEYWNEYVDDIAFRTTFKDEVKDEED